MINAKEELLETLQEIGKSIEDIEFAGVYYDCSNYDIGKPGARCATEDTNFLLDFLNFSYDEGFGMQWCTARYR